MADLQPFAGMSQEETLQHILLVLMRISDNLGALSPDAANRLRVTTEAQTVTVSGSLTSAGTVSTVSTVSALTNMAQAGGHPLNQMLPAMLLGTEAHLRRNIVFS